MSRQCVNPGTSPVLGRQRGDGPPPVRFIPSVALFYMNDLTGKTFNCLTVTGYTKINQGPRWTCKCSCGAVTYAKTHDLIASRKKSCGHLRTEHNKKFMSRIKEMNKFKVKGHGDPYGWATIDDSLDELAGA